MPIVRIDIQEGKSTAYKRSILHGVRDAITSVLGVPDERVTQRIIEAPTENIDTSHVRSDRLTVIEIAMLPGRNAELKERLYKAISHNLSMKPGIADHDIIVMISDPSAECFFLNGRIQCDMPQEENR